MKYEFYLDIFWVTNFVMDFCALLFAGLFRKGFGLSGKRMLWRFFVAAAIGSTGSAFLFLILGHFGLYQALVHLLLNPLMVWISFRSKGWKEFIKDYFIVCLVMMLAGGIISWGVINLGGIKHFWLFGSIAAVIFLLLLHFLAAKKMEAQLCEILLKTPKRSILLTGFLDTGNLLMDPFVNQPVHIIQDKWLQPELEAEEMTIRYIPYHSLGQENGLLPVVTMNSMYIKRNQDGGEKAPIYVEKPVFGLAKEKLFQKYNYQVILNMKGIGI